MLIKRDDAITIKRRQSAVDCSSSNGKIILIERAIVLITTTGVLWGRRTTYLAVAGNYVTRRESTTRLNVPTTTWRAVRQSRLLSSTTAESESAPTSRQEQHTQPTRVPRQVRQYDIPEWTGFSPRWPVASNMSIAHICSFLLNTSGPGQNLLNTDEQIWANLSKSPAHLSRGWHQCLPVLVIQLNWVVTSICRTFLVVDQIDCSRELYSTVLNCLEHDYEPI